MQVFSIYKINHQKVFILLSNQQVLADAFKNKESNIQVSGSGRVTATLPDDNEGSRHQRFIIELDSGLTLLVSHNIDIAPKINSLVKGDQIEFYGEYDWNTKGGVVHWTHHDPDGSHEDGWLKHKGRIYQ
jgi:tRNA(Ile2) C34 agmatinyltransferase TiaS